MHDLSMPLWERYLMTIEEASSYFRIGENKLRQLVIPVLGADKALRGLEVCSSLPIQLFCLVE